MSASEPRYRRLIAVVALAMFAAGCSSTGGGLFSRGGSSSEIDPDFFRKQAFCPPVQVRSGTETFQIFERGQEGNAGAVRYQASLGKTARECSRPDPQTLAVKIGLEGRVVAGPRGGAGQVDLPLRVAAAKQSTNDLLFSQLYRLTVPVQAPSFSVDFSQVISDVRFAVAPEDQDIIVFVGFDQGPG